MSKKEKPKLKLKIASPNPFWNFTLNIFQIDGEFYWTIENIEGALTFVHIDRLQISKV